MGKVILDYPKTVHERYYLLAPESIGGKKFVLEPSEVESWLCYLLGR